MGNVISIFCWLLVEGGVGFFFFFLILFLESGIHVRTGLQVEAKNNFFLLFPFIKQSLLAHA